MILSHHGKQEFGSPVEPLTREALLLNIIDDLDAKMVILDKAYAATTEGEFTTKIFPLDERTFYKMKSK
jgi:3'-5' exoribonuclease